MRVPPPSDRSELYTVTPRRGIVLGLYLGATLVLLVIILQIAVRPMRDFYGPLVWWRDYEDAPVGQIVRDLEASGVIPPGSTWDHPGLAARRTSLRLVLASPNDALAELAKSSGLMIRYRVGYHGNIIAAPRISHAPTGRGTAKPEIDVKLEREILSRRKAPSTHGGL